MDLIEGVGQSSSPLRSLGAFSNPDVRLDVYNRLLETRHQDAVCNPEFREQLDARFNRLPPRCQYGESGGCYVTSKAPCFGKGPKESACFSYSRVKHKNVVRFIGVCTKSPHLCILTGCRFWHCPFPNKEGVMTAETGTYRWMAPEIINHHPYNQKADVFSFAIVLWELVTAKVPYDTLTPLQAALGVRQGLRPDLPEDAHPKLLKLMERSWDDVPPNRPSFTDIKPDLENILKLQENGASNST